jgi:hypothetical protein
MNILSTHHYETTWTRIKEEEEEIRLIATVNFKYSNGKVAKA